MKTKILSIIIMFIILATAINAVEYNVTEHFGGCLGCCVEWINNTVDTCIVTKSGTYTMASGTGYNFTDIRLGGEQKTESRPINNGTAVTAVNDIGLVGVDLPTTVDIQRTLFRIKDGFLNGGFINNVEVSTFQVYTESVRNWGGDRKIRLLRIKEGNNWEASAANWTHFNSSDTWIGAAGLNESNTDYYNTSDSEETAFSGGTSKEFTFNQSWFTEWENGTISNNGFLFRSETDYQEANNYVIFRDVDETDYPYFIINTTNSSYTAVSEYVFKSDAIIIKTDNVTLEMEGVTFTLDGTSSNAIEIDGNRFNTTINNFNGRSFNRHIYSSSANAQSVYLTNITTFGGAGLWVLANESNVTNAYIENSDFTAAVVIGGENMYFNNITIANCTGDIDCFVFDDTQDSEIRNVFITRDTSTTFLHSCFRPDAGTRRINFTNIECSGNSVTHGFIAQGNNLSIYNFTTSNNKYAISNEGLDNVFNNVTAEAGDTCARQQETTNNYGGYYNINCDNFSTGISNIADYGNYENITINNVGVSSSENQYLISLSPMQYSGQTFDTLVIAVDSTVAVSAVISADDTNVISVPGYDGTGNIDLWLVNIPAAAVPFSTLYLQAPPIFNCQAIAAIYGGTCYYSEGGYYLGNGLGLDYTYNATVKGIGLPTVIPGYTDPPYLNYNLLQVQNSHPISELGDYNSYNNIIIGNNTFYSLYRGINITGDNNNVTNTHFRYVMDDAAIDTGSNNLFCVNGEGNFYNEDLSPESGDCGQGAVTDSSTDLSTFYANFTEQDGWTSITYRVLADGVEVDDIVNGSSALVPIGTTSIEIIPFDGVVNGTHFTNVSINATTIARAPFYWYNDSNILLYNDSLIDFRRE